jgi:Chalcone isomerase-like
MKLQRRRLMLSALLTPWLVPAHAQAQAQVPTPAVPPELASELPGARLQGQGRLRFLGLRVYDAKLWVGPQALAEAWANVPFALEIDYARELKGAQIAERSLAEMKRQAEIPAAAAARWLALMAQLFPDVKKGDRLSALNLPGNGARFFLNGTLRGEPRDAEFAQLFFGIWLSPQTSEPSLREALLGRSPS